MSYNCRCQNVPIDEEWIEALPGEIEKNLFSLVDTIRKEETVWKSPVVIFSPTQFDNFFGLHDPISKALGPGYYVKNNKLFKKEWEPHFAERKIK